MSYKCCDCGHIFDDGEQRAVKEYHPEVDGTCYEEFFVCPVCGGGYEETIHCGICGGEFTKDELYCGVCEDCLSEAITYDNVLQYLLDYHLLGEFMFDTWFKSSVPKIISEELEVTLQEWFLRLKANDLLCGTSELLDKCREFVEEDDFSKADFADWVLERKEANYGV